MNINLLPIRERRNYAIFISIGALVMVVIFAATFLTLSYNKSKTELADANMQLENMKGLRELQEQEYEKVVSTNEIENLKQYVKQLNDTPNNTVELMQHFTQLLPKRGYVRNIDFDKAEKISLEVQFDTIREASTYLNALSSSPYVQDVSMEDMKAEEFYEKMQEEENWKLAESLKPRYLTKYTIMLNQKEIAKLKKEDKEI